MSRKYQRRLRAVRDLMRMVEDLSSSEAAWKNTPVASRNKQMLSRWKSQVKVSNSAHYTLGIVYFHFVK